MLKILILCLVCAASCATLNRPRYNASWASLDTRPAPSWYDEAKIGIFLHWGVFSVPSFVSEWFWWYWKGDNKKDAVVDFMSSNYPPSFTYQDFARDFTAEFYNPSEWAELFEKSGAKYVVLTTKHHEGYTLWPSKYSFGWNAGDVGPHRDLVGDFVTAVRLQGLKVGLYHSLFEWFNPIYLSDKENLFRSQEFVDNKMLPEMYELIENYQPSLLWSDGEGEALDVYFKSTEFLAWLYNDSPVRDEIVTNDRWGNNTSCQHGDFYSCQDRYNPGTLQPHKWENAMTLDKSSWGYRRNAQIADFFTIHELLETLAQTVSCGGNLLINVGPTKEGTIAPIFQERLLELGQWLSINGEAIYNSKPWVSQNDTFTSDVWYTFDGSSSVYAIVLNWPETNVLQLESVADLFNANATTITLLGQKEDLKWFVVNNVVNVQFPDISTTLSEWAWVLKFSA